jgi:hypothetical protein
MLTLRFTSQFSHGALDTLKAMKSLLMEAKIMHWFEIKALAFTYVLQ